MSKKGNSKDNYQQLLYLLKTKGDMSASVLSQRLSMTMMGARQLLLKLGQDGLVESYQKVAHRGRPKQLWTLSKKGHARFGDRHADLTLTLLDSIKVVIGDAGLESLISHREKQMLKEYQAQLAEIEGVEQKLERLADIRSREGYMAEVLKEDDGRLFLIENHCPICAAAQNCQSFCRSELKIFSICLGVKLERCEYILQGDRRCMYKIMS